MAAESENVDDTSEASDVGEADDIDLSAMPDSEIAKENFASGNGTTLLMEDQILFEDDDLPTPEEIDSELDFTQNT